MRNTIDVQDAQHTVNVEGWLMDTEGWMLCDFQPFVRDNVMLSVWSAPDDVESAYVAGVIEAPKEVPCILSLMRQGVRAVVDLQPRNAACALALSEKGDALWRVETIVSERNDALRRD